MTRARVWDAVRWAATLAVVAFWFVALRPQALGGPTGFELVWGKSMQPVFHPGDLVVGHHHSTSRIGDVIAYRVPEHEVGAGAHVIHRIVGGDARAGFLVQGDNRTAPDPWRPTPHDVVGSAWVHLNGVGKLLFYLHSPIFLASIAAGVAVAWILFGRGDDEDDQSADGDLSAA